MDLQCNSNSPLDIEDIEDLFEKSSTEVTKNTAVNSKLVVPKVKKRAKKGIRIEEAIDCNSENLKQNLTSGDNDEECFLPGQAKIYVKTWGCSHNVSDGEYMSGILASQGYAVQDDKASADLWILNSCTVKNPSEDHFRNEIDSGLNQGKKVVLSGCVPQGKPDAEYIKG